MRYFKRITASTSLLVFLFVLGAAVNTQGQIRTRRVVVVQRPFFHTGFWRPYGYYDPFYDPYFYDPYLRAQREKYYLRQEVREKSNAIAKQQRKYRETGSPKELEKIAKNRRE